MLVHGAMSMYVYMPRESEQLVQHDKKMMDVFIITLEAFVGKHTVIFSHGGLKYK